jgi:hypothetical protein
MKLALSPAAAGLLRALIARAGIDRDRILLSDFRSVDWQSLTFVGERHEMELRVPGPEAAALAERLTAGLTDAEFSIRVRSSPTSDWSGRRSTIATDRLASSSRR